MGKFAGREDVFATMRILTVSARENHLLEVNFDNGTTVILNMAARLDCIRFMALRDMAIFQSAATDGQFIRWGSKVEISLNEIFHLAQK